MPLDAIPDSALEPIPHFDAAWRDPVQGARVRLLRRAAEALHEELLGGPRVLSVRTLPLTNLPYPTRYAFWGAAASPAPYVSMTHRCLLVQFFGGGKIRSLLFNPTDVECARKTPFFAQVAEKYGRLESLLIKHHPTIEAQLAALGLSPADIDYVAFDHFHTQDLRPILGTTDGSHAARFPNAKLLAPRAEWIDWDDLHPMQAAWFIRDGRSKLKMENVLLTDRDLHVGDGLYLLRTPGHTSGNQTLVLNTDSGVWGVSENGTCVDNWSPVDSRIPGLRRYARELGLDVILNANTPESAANQYASMILERTVVSRVPRAPAFVQMLSSSEVTPTVLAPALSPTLLHEGIRHGEVVRS